MSTAIEVRTPSANYTVHIGPGLLADLAQRIAALHTTPKAKLFVVTSPVIWSHWSERFLASFGGTQPVVLQVLAGEQYKRFSTLESLAEQLAEHGADRDSILIAFGGGVLGDMTGFLAAIYMRGIRYVQVPTTALAQIDSSVGGKTGANLAAGKNLIGSFHHPLAVFADIDTLSTLPENELRAGLQESVKAGIIRDRELFDYMEAHTAAILAGNHEALTRVIADSVQMKVNVVAEDEFETGVRMLLNLGHTLGHAIEAATRYEQLLHGEAIAWGMIAATSIAQKRGMVTSAQVERITNLVRAYGPLKPFTADVHELVSLTAKDKKNRSDSRRFILPVGIGDATVVRDVTEAELTVATEELFAQMPTREDLAEANA
ncbi:3-dehydroquinate synthase [Granulicella cerasi]|uniref:3-dehydroquinate synthase n=1 Tax=Granulicella cerasi TaxID=741063 RepID=A0ABW1Z5K7_9BACT|nr:3-dehydroquinate synthase [Granulicella cerasi]